MHEYKGNTEIENTLEERLLRVSILIVAITSTLWGIFRSAFGGIAEIVIYQHWLTAIIATGLYFFHLRSNKFEITALLFFTLMLASSVMGYFPGGGISGTIIPISIVSFAAGLLILPPRYFIAFAFIWAITIVSLGVLEIFSPDLADYKESRITQLISSIFIYIYALSILGVFLFFYKKEYLSEEERKAVLNKKILNEKENVEASERHKSKLLAAIWQEINIPFQNITQTSEKLRETSVNQEQQTLLVHLSKNNLFLSDILSYLFENYRNLSGKAPVPLTSFTAPQLADDLKFILKANNHSIEISKEIPTMLVGNVKGIKQAIGSLANNAIPLSKENEIKISINLLYKEGISTNIRIQLECENGLLNSKEQRSVFLNIYQDEEPGKNESPDLLANFFITKNLVEALGSTIHFDYKTGEGFKLFFDLKLKVASQDNKA